MTIVALAIGCQWTSNHIVHCAIGAGKTVTFTLTSTTFVIRNGLQGNILESYVLLFQFISVLLQFLFCSSGEDLHISEVFSGFDHPIF